MARAAPRAAAYPRTIVLDSEAVSALAEQRSGMAEQIAAAWRGDHRVVIPSVVLAEVMTGTPRDTAVWHVVKKIPVIAVDKGLAALAGTLREAADGARPKKRDLTVDALVAAVGVHLAPSVILTADPDDMKLLVGEHDVKVRAVGQLP